MVITEGNFRIYCQGKLSYATQRHWKKSLLDIKMENEEATT